LTFQLYKWGVALFFWGWVASPLSIALCSDQTVQQRITATMSFAVPFLVEGHLWVAAITVLLAVSTALIVIAHQLRFKQAGMSVWLFSYSLFFLFSAFLPSF
jgi:hypothetical protein